MNLQTITDKIHEQSDTALKSHIDNHVLPLFNEARDIPYNRLRDLNPSEWNSFGSDIWIGEYMKRYRDLAFLYLRDKWREQAVSDFINKVTSITEIQEALNSPEPCTKEVAV